MQPSTSQSSWERPVALLVIVGIGLAVAFAVDRCNDETVVIVDNTLDVELEVVLDGETVETVAPHGQESVGLGQVPARLVVRGDSFEDTVEIPAAPARRRYLYSPARGSYAFVRASYGSWASFGPNVARVDGEKLVSVPSYVTDEEIDAEIPCAQSVDRRVGGTNVGRICRVDRATGEIGCRCRSSCASRCPTQRTARRDR